MDVRRRPVNLLPADDTAKPEKKLPAASRPVQASDALPLPIRYTNWFFSLVFFVACYFLMVRWREKVRSSSPLHLLSFSEILGVVALVASFTYLLNFFGIGIIQSFLPRGADDDFISGEDVGNDVGTMNHKPRIHPRPVSDSLLPPVSKAAAADDLPPLCPPFMPNAIAPRPPLPPVKSVDPIILSSDDEEIVRSVVDGTVPSYSLESKLGDCRRAAAVRREALRRMTGRSLDGLPLEGFDYDSILGQCCEMPIGYVTLPVGIAGPLLLDGKCYYVPMATTEGCLVASTNRGCKAIRDSGGAESVIFRDGMTRAPAVRFDSAKRAAQLKFFLEDPSHFEELALVFNRSSRFARLQSIQCAIAGKNLYIRFCCKPGDAMGMNMVSKGVQNVLQFLQSDFPDMEVVGISGNFCSDKKPAAVNWIEGRGKSVVCEAVITEEIVKKVLKTTVPALVELNKLKNLVGSALAGALGGFNAHASNIVTAVFIATGQDPAQNVESSHCLTMLEPINDGRDLHISVTMPAIEVGTVGGGAQLASQSALLDLLGVKGANVESPGANARLLSTIVAGSVLAGELSLMSAIAAGQLVKSHMKYNRSSRDMSKVSS
uniref:3-hydroxy-3-methylglutaryl coenzyme A reductase n=1 Tax=Alisma plantago-aquatica subsp. orientale TaxID=262913 RepID=A0A0R7RHZ3_ALIPL|nr:3-hydroxy-3-methylglutaryl-CoA reductase [Alisma plantago-aquatica subsp. orientale]